MRIKGQRWCPECYGKIGDINISTTNGNKENTLPYHLQSPRLVPTVQESGALSIAWLSFMEI